MFGEWVGPGNRVVMLVAPNHTRDFVAREYSRIATSLRDAGAGTLVPWTEETIQSPEFASNLRDYAGICFAAEMPHDIIPLLRSTGLDRALVEAAREGFVVYASNMITTILGPDIRYTTLKDYRIDDYGIEDTSGLDLTTDQEGRPTLYIGNYRGTPSSKMQHPRRVATEIGCRVCVIPPASIVTIRDGEVACHGRRTFNWFDPTPARTSRTTEPRDRGEANSDT